MCGFVRAERGSIQIKSPGSQMAFRAFFSVSGCSLGLFDDLREILKDGRLN